MYLENIFSNSRAVQVAKSKFTEVHFISINKSIFYNKIMANPISVLHVMKDQFHKKALHC